MEKVIDFYLNEEVVDQNKISEIEELYQSGMPLSDEDVSLLLRNLSYLVRQKIADLEGKSMQEYSYSYKCDLAQSMITYYLKGLGIPTVPVNTHEVIEGVCGHSFVVARIQTIEGEKNYLIDPTYLQFFGKEGCDPKNFVVIQNKVCIAPDPGYFIVQNHREETVLPLLEDGYSELTEDVAKAYGDSFFQTKQGIDPSQIQYYVASGSDYIRWFFKNPCKLSKSEEELRNMNLWIGTSSDLVEEIFNEK